MAPFTLSEQCGEKSKTACYILYSCFDLGIEDTCLAFSVKIEMVL